MVHGQLSEKQELIRVTMGRESWPHSQVTGILGRAESHKEKWGFKASPLDL